jgi:glutathione S-transferase
VIRLAFIATGTAFDDVRLPLAFTPGQPPVRAEFDALKASGALPLGQVPILESGDVKIFQSKAIARFVAAKTGLMGSNAEEAALIDAVCETVFELRDAVAAAKDDAAKAALPAKLAGVLKGLAGVVGEAGFSVGRTLSLADLYIFYFAGTGNVPTLFGPGCADAIAACAAEPKIAAIVAAVAAIPAVAAWEAGREGRGEKF